MPFNVYAKCSCAECHLCRMSQLQYILLSVVMQCVIRLNVVAPLLCHPLFYYFLLLYKNLWL
jgi:hypothetical protein